MKEHLLHSQTDFFESLASERDKLVYDGLDLRGVWDLKLIGPNGELKDHRQSKNVICQVGKNQILAASAAEYLNQFGYMAIGTNSLVVNAASNATPIVIGVTSAYGLSNGQGVTISGVGGNAAANGANFAKTATYTSTTFGLYSNSSLATPVAGTGGYTSGGIVTVTPASTDIALLSQLAISTLVTPTNPSAPILQFQYTFGAGIGTGSVAECGLFDAASSGNILSHLTFGVITKGASDSLQLTYQLS